MGSMVIARALRRARDWRTVQRWHKLRRGGPASITCWSRQRARTKAGSGPYEHLPSPHAEIARIVAAHAHGRRRLCWILLVACVGQCSSTFSPLDADGPTAVGIERGGGVRKGRMPFVHAPCAIGCTASLKTWRRLEVVAQTMAPLSTFRQLKLGDLICATRSSCRPTGAAVPAANWQPITACLLDVALGNLRARSAINSSAG